MQNGRAFRTEGSSVFMSDLYKCGVMPDKYDTISNDKNTLSKV